MKHSFWWRVWRVARWPLGIIALYYVGLVIYRIPHAAEVAQTKEVVAQIHAQKLGLDDVLGKNLPPPPDAAAAATTLAGIDVNGNGIRDDVEWAIFNKYPNSARIRAAELQYAMALQNELTSVFNSDTFVAVAQEESRAYGCIFDISNGDLKQQIQLSIRLQKEVSALVFNTPNRKQKTDEVYNDYATAHGDINGDDCDVDLKTLPN